MPAETVYFHVDTTQFAVHIGQVGEGVYRARPIREHLLLLTLVGSYAQRSAEVVENDGRIGKIPGESDEVGYLVVEQPGIEGEVALLQAGKAFTEFRIRQ